MTALVKTDDSMAGLVLRLTIGLVIVPHGAQKLFGLFGGHGFAGTMGSFTGTMHLPWLVAVLVIIGESLGSLALLTGFLTRFAAAGVAVIMVGAIWMVHWPNGFFMNWSGAQPGEGFEYHLLVIGMAAAVVILGGGKWSLDGLIARWLDRRPAGSGLGETGAAVRPGPARRAASSYVPKHYLF